jgi:histidine phosphotransferase ChpT
VNNGAEFLSEEGFNLQGQAMELITSSAFTAVTRLQFYRMTYGNVKEHGETDLSEKQKLSMDFFVGSKITLDWPDSHTDSANVSLSAKMARIICNLLLVASGALSRGGTIAVRIGHDAANLRQVTVTATGANVKRDPDMDKIFANQLPISELSPKNVQVYLTKRFTDELKATIVYTVNDESMVLQVSQPAG